MNSPPYPEHSQAMYQNKSAHWVKTLAHNCNKVNSKGFLGTMRPWVKCGQIESAVGTDCEIRVSAKASTHCFQQWIVTVKHWHADFQTFISIAHVWKYFSQKNYAEDYDDTTLHNFGMPFFHHLAIHIKSYRAKRWSLLYGWEELDVNDYRIPACQYCIPSNFCSVMKSSHTSFHYFRLPAKELHSPRETAYFRGSDITIPGGVLFPGIQTSSLCLKFQLSLTTRVASW